MGIYDGKITGPYRSERQFKKAVTDFWKAEGHEDDVIELENGEKEPGTPDVFAVLGDRYTFYEFKISDKNGVITFKNTQPHFYKLHPLLNILIVAWDARYSRVVTVRAEKIAEAKSLRYKLPEARR